MTLLGDKGLTQLARLNHEAACDLADALSAVKGVKVLTPRYFNEIAFETSKPADTVLAALEKRDVIGGVRASRLFPGSGLDNVIVAAATECVTQDDIADYAKALAEVLK
jgi:glycine dehydrogenase subunit 1